MLLSLPVLFTALYYAMPMTIFEQAKDMKLDPAYFFFAISGLSLLFCLWKSELKTDKNNLIILIIAGILVGFSFSVKFTSLMLILGSLGLIAYRILGLSGYTGYFFLFLAIFTYADLWKILNVPMPRDNTSLMHTVGFVLAILGILSISFGHFSKKNISKEIIFWIKSSVIFLFAVAIGCLPWLAKNSFELGTSGLKGNPMSMLNGSGGAFVQDYSPIYTKDELKEKEKLLPTSMNTDGQAGNEDM